MNRLQEAGLYYYLDGPLYGPAEGCHAQASVLTGCRAFRWTADVCPRHFHFVFLLNRHAEVLAPLPQWTASGVYMAMS